jgi:hypothetical protein
MVSLPISGTEVYRAIQGELNATPDKYPYKITSVSREGSLLIVGVARATRSSQLLDESLEGTNAWWANPGKGDAKVRAVDVEEDQIVLKDKKGSDPAVGEMIFLYPPKFLEPLREAWKSEAWGEQINSTLMKAVDTKAPGPLLASLDGFPWLRRGQKRAQELHRWPISFLWGPPGTGKTRTLGAMIASLVSADPKARVLLVSTTNTATDQALISVDDALKELAGGEVTRVRAGCKRIGTQFLSEHYHGRSHLMPQRDEKLLRELQEHQRRFPHEGDVVTQAWWKEENERLRNKLRVETLTLIEASRVSAMTTTRACFDLEGLRKLPKFDYLVVDEASQVSIAHALAILPLAKHTIFAGDPMQLSPICQSTDGSVVKWMGNSPFLLRKKVSADAVCFLSEQSRMSKQINDLVSGLFYEDRLEVCNKADADGGWHDHRDVGCEAEDRVKIIPIPRDGYYTQQYEGLVRHNSAEKIVEIVKDLLSKGVLEEDIQVLTPFRSQRRLIKIQFKQNGIRVPVSTVHRAQGSEKKVIIFDPVDGASEFMNFAEGHRLINVAFSRAKAQLYILLSPGDAQNQKLGKLAPKSLSLPLFCELITGMDQYEELVGRNFAYLGMKLTGKRIVDGRSIRAVTADGREQQFGLAFMEEKCGDSENCPKGCSPHNNPNSRCCLPT